MFVNLSFFRAANEKQIDVILLIQIVEGPGNYSLLFILERG